MERRLFFGLTTRRVGLVTTVATPRPVRVAIYTRKSVTDGSTRSSTASTRNAAPSKHT
jgi:hypothetical protein